MKKLFYILLLLVPFVVGAQQNWVPFSPADYAWQNVGNAGFSANGVEYNSLAFNLSGQPYVAFEDLAYAGRASVMKFDGTNWVNVGNAGFSAGSVDFTSLAISPSGEPYVAYVDRNTSYKATVMYYDAPTRINETLQSKFVVYPNPAKDKITIKTSGAMQQGNLTIVNIKGQELITRQLTLTKTQLDVSSLPNGAYFVRLTNDKTVTTGKIIKD